MNLVLRTYSSDSEYNGDCDYALIRLTTPVINQVRARVNLAKRLSKRDSSFLCLEYWDHLPQYFKRFDGIEDILEIEKLDDGKPLFVDDAITMRLSEEDYQRVETSRIVAMPASVYWECRPKHSDWSVETPEVYLKQLPNSA